MIKETILNLIPVIPEIFLLVATCVILLVDLFTSQRKKLLTFVLAELALLITACGVLYFYNAPVYKSFNGMFIRDSLSNFLELIIIISSFFSFLYARQYIQERDIDRGAYYILGLFATLGMIVLVSSNSLLVLFLGVELFSLPVYAMVALYRTSGVCSEAAVKYFVMGVMASAILLYGMSILYGATGSLSLTHIANVVSSAQVGKQALLIFALVFIMIGIAFKLGVAPLHMWVPDVYQGAPTSVTLFIGSAAKIAAFGLLIRLLLFALPGLHIQWRELLMVISLISIVLGNVVAIVQKNIKRMLAYSSIAHMGYMLLGLIAGISFGYAAAMFYMVAYVIMFMGAFAIITVMSNAGVEAESIDDYRGLNSRNPWLSFMMLLIMFSMAGIPPTIGFFAKLGVLEALIKMNFIWLAVIAIIFAVIGAYYYLMVVKVMYFEEPVDHRPIEIKFDVRIAIIINGIAVLAFGLFPGVLINLCRAVFGG